MNFYQRAFDLFRDTDLAQHFPALQALIDRSCTPEENGHIPKWEAALAQLPEAFDCEVDYNASAITAQFSEALDAAALADLQAVLEVFIPWRKGPFNLGGVEVDTEWRSDWKWDRIAPHIAPLAGRTVLDVGCGNGYHLWRMAGAGAGKLLGIDPNLLFNYQFEGVSRFMGMPASPTMLPIGIDDFPTGLQLFDTVFSMGVLYHRKSPIDHLFQLRDCLVPGGELVLETLIIDGDAQTALIPEDRYGKMRNVWFIPTPAMCELWLRRCGYKDIRCVDVSTTSVDEQRRSHWMRFESLPNFLDPDDPTKTVEGYPAPKRGVFVATA